MLFLCGEPPPPNSPTPLSMLLDHCSYMLNRYKISEAQWNIMKRRSGIWGNNICRIKAESRAQFPEREEEERYVSHYGDREI